MGQTEFDAICRLLESSKVEFKLMEHDPVFTSEQAAALRNVGLHRGVKAIVVCSNSDQFFLFCLPADKRIDLKKAAALAGQSRLFLAPAKEVFRITGCEVGSVSPFSGLLSGFPAFFDESILQNEWVDFSVGLHTRSVEMKSRDLAELAKPVLGSFSLQ